MTSAWRGAALLAVALSLPACNLTFTTADDPSLSAAPQDPFALQIPLNDANGVQPLNTQFAWGALPGAVSYELEISLDANFSQIVHTESGITITQVFSKATLTHSTTYYWRIRGSTTVSSRLAAGSPYKFTTVPALSAPTQFFLLTPAGGGVTKTPLFSWTTSTNAAVYTLTVDVNPSFSTPVIQIPNLHVTQVTSPVTLSPATTYYWSVTASNSLGWWTTPTASFTTGP